MLKSILVGLDGSAFSDSATALGLRWAEAFGTRLAGLAVVDEPGILALEPVPMGAAYFSADRDVKALAEARAGRRGWWRRSPPAAANRGRPPAGCSRPATRPRRS